MEEAPAADLYSEGLHPYTQLLFSCAAGVVPGESDSNPFRASSEPLVRGPREVFGNSFCSFAPRCPKATERCFKEHPVLNGIKSGHSIRCFNVDTPAV